MSLGWGGKKWAIEGVNEPVGTSGDQTPHGSLTLLPSLYRHDVVEVAGLTSFSFGEDDDCHYTMIFKKGFAPSDEGLDCYRHREAWDPPRRLRRSRS